MKNKIYAYFGIAVLLTYTSSMALGLAASMLWGTVQHASKTSNRNYHK